MNNNQLRHRRVSFPENVVSDVRIIDNGSKLPKPVPVRHRFRPLSQEYLHDNFSNLGESVLERRSDNRSAYQASMPRRRESLSDKVKTD